MELSPTNFAIFFTLTMYFKFGSSSKESDSPFCTNYSSPGSRRSDSIEETSQTAAASQKTTKKA